MVKDTIDVFAENQAKRVDEFILKIIEEKTDFKGDINNMDEVSKYMNDTDCKLETSINAISGHHYKMFQGDKLISHFMVKNDIQTKGYNIKATMWLEEVNDEV